MPWREFTEPELTPTEWAYTAGIIDGEGCLGVYTRSRQHLGSRQITSSTSYRPRLSVVNTNMEVLIWLHERFGGNFRPQRSPRTPKGHKPVGLWDLQNVQMVFSICEHCMPFFIIKKAQAQLVLQFPFNMKCNQYTVEKTTAVERTKRRLYKETLRLNKRGVVVGGANDALGYQ